MLFIIVSFSQCASTLKLQDNLPLENKFNKVIQDIKKIEYVNDALAVGRFKTEANQKQDIIMSNEPYAEYANKVPELPEKIPFELKDDECVVSYLEKNKIKYFKIEGIVKKESTRYP